MSNVREAPWYPPTTERKELCIYNSITKNVVPFKTKEGNQVNWYICGPTVYDSAHLGHARAYVTFDIIRRIFTDYFNYDLYYVMNITDVDDKIILRARRNYLFSQYEKSAKDINTVIADIRAAFDIVIDEAKKRVVELQERLKTAEKRYVTDLEDQIKQSEIKTTNAEVERDAFEAIAKTAQPSDLAKLLELGKGALSTKLDNELGANTVDHSIFKALTEKYEQEFLEDLQALGVRDVDALTRVTEYIDHIIRFVEKIIANGYAYASNGSVYFDTIAFSQAKDTNTGLCKHFYAKLKPTAVGNLELAAEGEGALSSGAGDKRHPNDFALWKLSKPGEVSWDSPWGKGRPGWHIECSAMATDLFGTQFDIHTGGDDLKFPHHDNEVAQSEAYSDCNQWVNYFMHAGHLSIAGLKMSKSLKNFITIRQCLEHNTARQIRLLFLLQTWHGAMNYSDDSLKEAVSREQTLKQFFLNLQVLERTLKPVYAVNQYFSDADRDLRTAYTNAQKQVHDALCDNMNYPLAMHVLFDLVSSANKYLAEMEKANIAPKILILRSIGNYIEKMMRVFGVITDKHAKFLDQYQEGTGGTNEFATEVMDTFSAFRDSIRELGRTNTDPSALKGQIMALCDKVRDDDLPSIGIRLEDKASGVAVWKQESKEELARQKAEKLALIKQKQVTKLQSQIKTLSKNVEKYTNALTPPSEMFKTAKYTQWDDKGLPTHDETGAELSKSAGKAAAKAYAQRTKEVEELTKVAAGVEHTEYVAKLKTELQTLEEQLAQLEL